MRAGTDEILTSRACIWGLSALLLLVVFCGCAPTFEEWSTISFREARYSDPHGHVVLFGPPTSPSRPVKVYWDDVAMYEGRLVPPENSIRAENEH